MSYAVEPTAFINDFGSDNGLSVSEEEEKNRQGILAGIQLTEDANRLFNSSGGAGESINAIVSQAGGLALMDAEVREAYDNFMQTNNYMNTFVSDSHKKLSDYNTAMSDGRRGKPSVLMDGIADGLKMAQGLNEGQRSLFESIDKLRTSVAGAGQINPSFGIEAGMSQIANLIAGGAAIGLASMTGMPTDTATGIIDSMRKFGIDDAMIGKLTKAIGIFPNSQEKGGISTYEVQSLMDNTSLIDKLSSMDATTRKMLKEPEFRVRVIKKINTPSIYGEDFYSRYNQVSKVEQGIADDSSSSNQFNVSY